MGDRYKVRRYKREVLITLVLILDIILLAVIYAVAYMYSKWLKIKYLISWLRLSRCIQGTYSFSSIYILKGRAVFLRGRVVV
jgi:phosphatidylserine synthase